MSRFLLALLFSFGTVAFLTGCPAEEVKEEKKTEETKTEDGKTTTTTETEKTTEEDAK